MLLIPSGDRPLAGFTHRTTHTLSGYQLYAVEKWIVARERPYPFLVVYTADLTHTVVFDALEPANEALMRDTIHTMRKDSRPKQTPFGILMVTSLAHFRSDYTIVLVEGGLWTNELKMQLYANINLLRLGAAGRTALTLNAPSDSTKDRFYAAYLLPVDKDKSDNATSSTTGAVIELVKLIQVSLALFGVQSPQDGLFCDTTHSALSTWATQIYPPAAEYRIPSPSVVSFLLSQVLTVRNRLATMYHGHFIPKDPFAAPGAFTTALSNLPSHNHTPTLKTPSGTPSIPFASFSTNHITSNLFDALMTVETPEVATYGAGSIVEPISDINAFVSTVLAHDKGEASLGEMVRGIGKSRRRMDEESKEVGAVVRSLWGGGMVCIGVGTGEPALSGGDQDSDADPDDLSGLSAWNRRRVKDKLESWAGIGARRRFKTAIINDDDDTQLSSGQASPNSTSPAAPFVVPTIVTHEPSPPHVLAPASSHSGSGKGPNLPSTMRNRRPSPSARVASWSIPQQSSSSATSSSTPARPSLSSRRRSFPPYPKRNPGEKVLPLDHMMLDVALAGEFLVLYRRQQHLAHVLRATEILTTRLVDTSAHLRSVYSTLEAGEDISVLGELDTERVRASKMMQGVNTLWYEAEQMTLQDAWHVAAGGRRKVVDVRGKVFGTRAGKGKKGTTKTTVPSKKRGRRTWQPENRQWRVNGDEVMVDVHGRTESEAEEEMILEAIVHPHLGDEKDSGSEDVKNEENKIKVIPMVPEKEDGIASGDPLAWRPMWLLRFFTSWGRTSQQKAR